MLSAVEFMPPVIPAPVATPTGLSQGPFEFCRAVGAAAPVFRLPMDSARTDGYVGGAIVPNEPNFAPSRPENESRREKQSQSATTPVRFDRSRRPGPNDKAQNPPATPHLKMSVSMAAMVAKSRTSRAKQTQFPHLSPENEGPAEKQSQSAASPAPRRSSRDETDTHNEITTSREPGPPRAKQTQFPRFWPENEGPADKQSESAPASRCRPKVTGSPGYPGTVRPDAAASTAVFGLDAGFSVNRVADADARRRVCRFGQGRRPPIHRISQRRKSCP